MRWARIGWLVMLGVLACAPPASPPSNAPPAGQEASPTAGGRVAGDSAPASPAPTAGASLPAPDAAAAPTTDSAATAPPRPLTVGYSAISGAFLPAWMAQEAGLYAREGLDVDLRYATSTVLASALLAGEVPVAIIGGVEVITSNLAGSDLIMVAGVSTRPVLALMARPEIATPAELEGKRVGVSRLGSVTYYAAILGLRRAGLEPGRDVALVQAGGVPEILPMLESGAAEAGALSPPTWFEAEQRGYRQLLDFTTLDFDYPQTVVAVRRGYLAENRALVRDFLRAFVAGSALQRRDPDQALRVLGQYTRSTDTDILLRTYSAFRDSFAERPVVPPSVIAPVLALIANENPAAAQVPPEQFVDNTLIEEITAGR